jgi:hypothetical protein
LFVGFHGRSVLPSAPKPKQLLALFILNANNVVTTSACVEELWGDEPPSTAGSTLQTYVLQIRKALADLPGFGSLEAVRSLLVTKDYGYLLCIEPHEVDAFRFDGLVRAGGRPPPRATTAERSGCSTPRSTSGAATPSSTSRPGRRCGATYAASRNAGSARSSSASRPSCAWGATTR